MPVVVTGALDYPRDANFDYADMWAFVWDAYTHREQWWLTGEEEALQQEILSHHEDATMESIILDTFKFIDAGTGEKLDSSNRTIKMTNTQIIEYLPKNITNTRASQMGVKKALDGLGVKKTKSRLYLMPPLFPTVMLNHVSDGEIPI
ncbi:hypothetical protein bplSymb_SCF02406P004 [Bathymodiolus platifrons methanotrophic gill symbiont]|nr:hypothetical protein bplSymb_SCF02406P004 [Bathymodiolus platifrons methanotrophic gill symbiont]